MYYVKRCKGEEGGVDEDINSRSDQNIKESGARIKVKKEESDERGIWRMKYQDEGKRGDICSTEL